MPCKLHVTVFLACNTSVFFKSQYHDLQWKFFFRYISNLRMGNKHSLVLKFGQLMSVYKIKTFVKKLYKKCGLGTSSRPSSDCKE